MPIGFTGGEVLNHWFLLYLSPRFDDACSFFMQGSAGHWAERERDNNNKRGHKEWSHDARWRRPSSGSLGFSIRSYLHSYIPYVPTYIVVTYM